MESWVILLAQKLDRTKLIEELAYPWLLFSEKNIITGPCDRWGSDPDKAYIRTSPELLIEAQSFADCEITRSIEESRITFGPITFVPVMPVNPATAQTDMPAPSATEGRTND
jgi:hypothetical protein